MSDISENSNDKGFRINARGISCIPCRCKRQFYYKETKTTKENQNNVITTNTIIDKRNTKFGGGRNVSPDETGIFQSDMQNGSVEVCSTGWNDKENRITPEELEERLEKLETDVDLMKKDIDDINKSKIKVD